MRIKGHIARLLVFVILISSLTFGTTAPVYAWKVGTHVYSANIIIDELRANNGSLEIEPYGKFPIKQEYKQAILSWPEYYRAGAMGPDVFPDIYVGQMVLHPGTSTDISGRLIDDIFKAAEGLPEASSTQTSPSSPYANANEHGTLTVANKEQAIAFVLGLTTHQAGDLFGHSYINKLSGGPWPDFVRDGVTQNNINIVLRYNILESYIDKKIPADYKTESRNSIAIPKQFIMDTMIGNGRHTHPSLPGVDYEDISSLYLNNDLHPVHFKVFFDMRRAVRSSAADSDAYVRRHKDDEGLASMDPVLAYHRAKEAYMEAWLADIDEGLEAWVATNEKVARLLLQPDGMEKIGEEYDKWAYDHLLKMFGAPDVAADIISKLGGVKKIFEQTLPDAVKEELKPIKEGFVNQILSMAYASNLTGNKLTYQMIADTAKNPQTYLNNSGLFPDGTEEQIIEDLGNFSTNSNAGDQTFAPYYNTLVAAKLNILGTDGITRLRRAAGSKDTKLYSGQDSTIMADFPSLDYGYDWVNKDFDWFLLYQGTDDRTKIFNRIFQVSDSAAVRDVTFGRLQLAYWDSQDLSGSCVNIDYSLKTAKAGLTAGLYKLSDIYDPSKAVGDLRHLENRANGSCSTMIVPVNVPGRYVICIHDGQRLLGASEVIEVNDMGELIGPDGTVLPNLERVTLYKQRFGYWERSTPQGMIGGIDLAVDYMVRVERSNVTIGLYKENDKFDPAKAIRSITPQSERGSFYTTVPIRQPGKYIVCAHQGTNLIRTAAAFEVTSEGDIITEYGDVYRNIYSDAVSADDVTSVPTGPARPEGLDGVVPGTPPGTPAQSGTTPSTTPAGQSGTGTVTTTPAEQSGTGTVTTTPAEQNSSFSWTGTWQTQWGNIAFTQQGNTVSGTYGEENYPISGTVKGNTFTGRFDEGDGYEGPVVLVMSADGNRFDGRWRYDYETDWRDWDGTRKH